MDAGEIKQCPGESGKEAVRSLLGRRNRMLKDAMVSWSQNTASLFDVCQNRNGPTTHDEVPLHAEGNGYSLKKCFEQENYMTIFVF